ncbi:MAG: hypothetical protein MPJ50_15155 [Pirellulales bacterium]|nr:hypothetical protein [Pirellulales bacterium]
MKRILLASLASSLLLVASSRCVQAQDVTELPTAGQDAVLDSPSARSFAPESSPDTWANPAIDGYGCGACGYSHCCYSDCGTGYCNDGCGHGSVLSQIINQFCPSDRCFTGFVSPITNPVFFEDPRTLTEARALFINHSLPDTLGGGDVQVYALQLRAALNDRLSVIAIKDGFVVGQPNAPHDDGWADIGIGFKYLLWADCCQQRLLAGGITYEVPNGQRRALQGNGDGEFNAFLSGAARLWDAVNWMGIIGVRVPTDHNEENQILYYSNHISRRFGCSNIYLVSETNVYHYLRSGNQTALAGIGGLDLYNFGSTGVAGNTVVTSAWGVKFKPDPSTEIGLAFEVPVTNREDVLDDRLTVDWIFRY